MRFSNGDRVKAICEELSQNGRLEERLSELTSDAEDGLVHDLNAKQWLATRSQEKSPVEAPSAGNLSSKDADSRLNDTPLAAESEEATPEVDAERLAFIQSLNTMTVAQLKEHLRARKLKLGGAKAELIQRLENHLMTEADSL
eukprot:scaffold194_cov329-Prasinococcus_capsulatus_cf.AAC.4